MIFVCNHLAFILSIYVSVYPSAYKFCLRNTFTFKQFKYISTFPSFSAPKSLYSISSHPSLLPSSLPPVLSPSLRDLLPFSLPPSVISSLLLSPPCLSLFLPLSPPSLQVHVFTLLINPTGWPLEIYQGKFIQGKVRFFISAGVEKSVNYACSLSLKIL